VLKQGRVTGALEPYFASPVGGDGKLFLVTLNGKLAVLEAGRAWGVLSVSDLGDARHCRRAAIRAHGERDVLLRRIGVWTVPPADCYFCLNAKNRTCTDQRHR
jgi:hypothetical protein